MKRIVIQVLGEARVGKTAVALMIQSGLDSLDVRAALLPGERPENMDARCKAIETVMDRLSAGELEIVIATKEHPRRTIYDIFHELLDAYEGQGGNVGKVSFTDWLKDMAESPTGTLRKAAATYIAWTSGSSG